MTGPKVVSLGMLLVVLGTSVENVKAMTARGVSDSDWQLTRSFLTLFNARDLVIYPLYGPPDSNLIFKAYKDKSLVNIQTAFINLPLSLVVPERYSGSEAPSVKLFLLGGNLDTDIQHLVDLSATESFTTVNIWLIRLDVDTATQRDVQEILKDLHLVYTSQVYAYTADPNGDITIWEVYKISKDNKEVEVLPYGKWTVEGGLVVNEANLWHRRIDMKGLQFRAASLFNKPYVTEVANGCQDSSCFKGMFGDVFHELQRIMNFTYTIRIPEDGEWGQKREDGTWTGAIGLLEADEVDIAPADFTVTSLRGQVVNYLPPLDDPHMRFFIANPAESFNWYAYVRPYTSHSWAIIIFGGVALAFIVTWIISKGKPEMHQKDFTLAQTFAFVSGTVLIKDWLTTPWTLRSKIAFFSVSFWGTLIYYHWEAMIISYLAVRTVILPFNSLEELMTETDFKIIMQAGTSYIDEFRYGNTPILKKAWNERIEPYLDIFPANKLMLVSLLSFELAVAWLRINSFNLNRLKPNLLVVNQLATLFLSVYVQHRTCRPLTVLEKGPTILEDYFSPQSKTAMADWIKNDKSYVMFDNYNVRIYYDDYISCQTLDIPREYFAVQFAMPIAKTSPYYEAFWFHTVAIEESGSLKQIKERYRNEPQKCPDYSGKSLGFGQTFTAFVALFGGLAFGWLLFVIELLYSKHLSRSSVDSLMNGLLESERNIILWEETRNKIKTQLNHLQHEGY